VRNTMGLIEPQKFSKFLWGDVFYNLETRKFAKQSNNLENPRSFVHFVLEPFYKIITCTLTSDKINLQRLLKIELGGIEDKFKNAEYEMDMELLLRLVLSRYFGKSSNTLTDVMIEQFKSAKDATNEYV